MADELNNTYLITGIVLACLLIVSELLGWSKCDAKAITQLHRCLNCKPVLDEEIPPLVFIEVD